MNNSGAEQQALPLERIVDFCAHLRQSGFDVGLELPAMLVQVAGLIGRAPKPKMVEAAWQPVVCKTRKQLQDWHEIFQQFWLPHKVRGSVKVTGSTKRTRNLQQVMNELQAASSAESQGESQQSRAQSTDSDSSAHGDGQQARAQGGASVVDPLDDRSQQQWLPQDLRALEALAKRVKRQLKPALSRRWRASSRGKRLHTRATVQRSAKLLGDGLIPVWRKRRHKAPELVILCDVSRSMEAHASFCLRVTRAFYRVMPVRAFVFHVHLNEITELLRRDSPKVQERVNAVTAGFQAGTRIGFAFKCMNSGGHKVNFHSGTRVWVFSDGYDTDGPDLLTAQLAAIKARGAKVVWFYPTQARPESVALQAAGPHIDQWIAAANFSSLSAQSALLL